MDEPYYVSFDVGGRHVGLDPKGHHKGLTGPTSHWNVDDIEASVRTLVDAGAKIQQEVTDVGGGKRVTVVGDPDGNGIALIQG